MRISDWSSDVCSSDLLDGQLGGAEQQIALDRLARGERIAREADHVAVALDPLLAEAGAVEAIAGGGLVRRGAGATGEHQRAGADRGEKAAARAEAGDIHVTLQNTRRDRRALPFAAERAESSFRSDRRSRSAKAADRPHSYFGKILAAGFGQPREAHSRLAVEIGRFLDDMAQFIALVVEIGRVSGRERG